MCHFYSLLSEECTFTELFCLSPRRAGMQCDTFIYLNYVAIKFHIYSKVPGTLWALSRSTILLINRIPKVTLWISPRSGGHRVSPPGHDQSICLLLYKSRQVQKKFFQFMRLHSLPKVWLNVSCKTHDNRIALSGLHSTVSPNKVLTFSPARLSLVRERKKE